MIDRLAALLSAHRYRFTDEAQLQAGIAQVLAAAGIGFKREARLTMGERIDFLVGDVGIEVKIAGGLQALTRQLFRYAECDQVGALLIATSRNVYARLPSEIHGKPVKAIVL